MEGIDFANKWIGGKCGYMMHFRILSLSRGQRKTSFHSILNSSFACRWRRRTVGCRFDYSSWHTTTWKAGRMFSIFTWPNKFIQVHKNIIWAQILRNPSEIGFAKKYAFIICFLSTIKVFPKTTLNKNNWLYHFGYPPWSPLCTIFCRKIYFL